VRGGPRPERQRQQCGHAADEADQCQTLATAFGGNQCCGQGATGDDGDREADAADRADDHDRRDGFAGRGEQHESRQSQQDEADGERRAVADPGDQSWRRELAGDRREEERAVGQAGRRAGSGGVGEHRDGRERQVEADGHGDDRDEAQCQRAGDQWSGHEEDARSKATLW
jgi:hypothetical protein